MKNKNVLIIRGHPTNLGGVVNLYNSLLPWIKKSKFNIFFFRSGAINRNKFHKFIVIRFFDILLSSIRLIFKIKRNNINLIHFNPSLDKKSILRESFLIFLVKYFNTNIKIITFFHGWEKNIEKDFKKNTFLTKLVRLIVMKSDAIIVLANEFKNGLLKLNVKRKKIKVISTSVDTKKYNIRKNYINNYLNILFLSRIIKAKGVLEIAKSIPYVNNNIKNMKIIFNFAGDGEYLPALKKFVFENNLGEYVKFLGYVRGEGKVKTLKECDVFILPSYYGEGCPVSVLEAMAAGLPVITTDVGCLKDIVVDGVNGFIVRPKNVDDIVEAVTKLIKNPDLMIEMGKRNSEKAITEFDNEIIFKKIEKIYDDVIKI